MVILHGTLSLVLLAALSLLSLSDSISLELQTAGGLQTHADGDLHQR